MDTTFVRLCYATCPYEILDIPNTATHKEINKSYKKLALKIHPDKCKHKSAKQMFNAIQLAKERLLSDDYKPISVSTVKQDKFEREKTKRKMEDDAYWANVKAQQDALDATFRVKPSVYKAVEVNCSYDFGDFTNFND